MSIAICTRCGAIKRSAIARCPECRFVPRDHEATAKAMVLTDHFLSREDLEAIAERIRTGKEVTYPEQVVQGIVDKLEENPNRLRVPVSFKVGVVVLLLGVIAVVVLLLAR